MTVATIKQNIFSPSEELQMKYTLWMNHLLVVYAFFMPISQQAKTAIFFIILILFLLRNNFNIYIYPNLKNKIIQAILLFFLINIVWIIGSDNIDMAKKVIKSASYLTYTLIFISIIDKRFVNRILTTFILSILLSEVISYLVGFKLLPSTLFLYGTEVYKSSFTDPAIFLSHTKYSSVLSITIMILIYKIINDKNQILRKSFTIIFIMTATINLFTIGGRLGYLLFIILFIFTIFFIIKKKYKKKIFISIAILLSIFYIAYSTNGIYKQRLNTSINSIKSLIDNPIESFQSSFGQRVGIWYYSKDTIKNNLIFGVGTGDHMDSIYSNIPNKHNFLKQVSHPHNQYISIITQFGIIGLIVFINIFYQILKFNFTDTKQKFLAYIITLGIFTSFFFVSDINKFWFPLWAFILSLSISTKIYKNIKLNKINSKLLTKYILFTILIAIYTLIQGSSFNFSKPFLNL